MPEPEATPTSGQVAPTQDPGSSTPGQSLPTTEASKSGNLPEKLKGKTAEEIASMYVNLETEIGKQSSSVAEARKLKQDIDVVLQALQTDPKLMESVRSKVQDYQSGKIAAGSSSDTPGDDKLRGQKSNSVDDIRISEQNRIISDFEKSRGLDKLAPEKRVEVYKQISTELVDLLDPNGTKPLAEILQTVRLDYLPKLLEKAFWLSAKEQLVDKGPLKDDYASIGAMASSNGKAMGSNGLTEHEISVAQKLGVNPEKYAKQKQKLNT